ncbi:MAG: NfeD family protein [Candidatus Nanopelagicales bacterium]|nr:NfeD family protein [Candidatus Nanopelagicales bacterium]
MDAWWVWLAAALVMGIVEVTTGGTLVFGMLSVGALAAAVAAAVTVTEFVPWLVFALVSVAMLALVRPVARKHAWTPGHLRTGTAALVGLEAVVTQRVTGYGGQIKLRGEVWSARSFDVDEVFEPGIMIRVIEIEGATALIA